MNGPKLVFIEAASALTFSWRHARATLLMAALALAAGPAHATVTNILVNDPAADTTARNTQSRSALVLGSGSVLLSAFTDSGSYDGTIGGDNDQLTGYARSLDGGVSWTDLGKLPLGPLPLAGDGGNPALAHGKLAGFGGVVPDTIYLATETFGPARNRLQIFRSRDNGLTFLPPVNGAPGFAPADVLTDPSIAVDNFPGGGQGTAYLAFRAGLSGNIFLTRSTDGGASWSSPATLVANEGVARHRPWLTVAANHEVHVFYLVEDGGNHVRVKKLSENFAVLHDVSGLLHNTRADGELGLYGSFRSRISPQAVVSPINPNLLFAVYSDASGSGDKAEVLLTFSTDGGVTWPAANQRRINDDATLNDQFAPALAIEPGGTKLFVGWYDRRRDAANYRMDTFGAIAAIDNAVMPPTVTPGPNFRISSESFAPVAAVDAAVPADFMGDHDTAQANENFFFFSWGDNRSSGPAQSDVRFARIPIAGPGGQLELAGALVAGGNGNGQIERNECNQLALALLNGGTATVGGISAVLSSLTPGVSIDQAKSTYPELTPGGTDTNKAFFAFTTSPSFVCGTTIELLLTVTTTNAGTFSFVVKLPTGSWNTASFESAEVPRLVANGLPMESTVDVPAGLGAIGKVTVALHLTHALVADVRIALKSPDGTTILLSANHGGSGDSYGSSCMTRAIFDDNAGVSVTLGTSPLLGRMRPEQVLAAFQGKSPTGLWTLHVEDDVSNGAVGELVCWSLGISTLEPEAVFTSAPNAPAGVLIPNATTIDVPLDVSGLTEAAGKVSVTITRLLHPSDQALDLSLIGPDGTTVLLSSNNGGTGDDYLGTLFDDSAVNFITAGTPPFTGRFRPEQPLAAFVGKGGSALNGTWRLRIRNAQAVNGAGALFSWALAISTPDCLDGGAPCVSVAATQVLGGNANGRLDPNECADLNLVVRNSTAVPMTGVTSSLTLFSLSPGVSVHQGSSPYPDIEPGQTGTNGTPFSISVDPTVPCGTIVQLLLSLTSAEGRHFDVVVKLQLGACGPMTFDSPAPPTIIPEPAGVLLSTLNVPDGVITSSIVKVAVSMRITHPVDSDLKVSLISPAGFITVDLTSNNGGANSDYGTINAPTTFDDTAFLSITDGSAPFAGTFRPQESLFKLVGLPAGSASGAWTLKVEDTAAIHSGGVLQSWSLSLCQGQSFSAISDAPIGEVALNNTNDVPLVVSGVTGALGKVSVALYLTHANIEDVDLYLVSPDNTIIPLASDNGGAAGSSYGTACIAPVVFDDDAPHSIKGASAPFVGTFRPERALAALIGKSGTAVNGTWFLRVVDDTENGSAGVLQCWGLNITPLACTNGPGPCVPFVSPTFALTVNSINPASGLSVGVSPSDNGGLAGGSSPFMRTNNQGTTVTLIAPALAGQTFTRWDSNGVLFTTSPTNVFTVNSSFTMTAVYSAPPVLHALTVDSEAPAAGVPITMDAPPDVATPFSRQIVLGTVVTLTAPATEPGGNPFLQWLVDGAVSNSASITLTMDADHHVVAQFVGPPPPTRVLDVGSTNPNNNVQMFIVPSDLTGFDDGLTPFSRTYLDGESIMITALPPAGKVFDRWDVDNGSSSVTNATITILMNGDRALIAIFRNSGPPPPPPPPPTGTHTLEVHCQNPPSGVQILVVPNDQNGNDDGLAPFDRTYAAGLSVMLTVVVPDGKVLDKWEVDSGARADRHPTITLLMDTNHEVTLKFTDGTLPLENPFALQFDGLDDYVSIPSSDSLSINGPITVEAWINRAEQDVMHSIVEKYGCTGDANKVGGYALRVTADNKLMFQAKQDCTVRTSAIGATSLDAGTWYYVAGVWDGSDLKVYVNGVLDGSVPSGQAPDDGDTPLHIGARGNNPAQSPFKGIIDEVRLWRDARTDAEIAGSMNTCLAGDEPNLVGYWRFNEGIGLVVHDSTVNGNNGLLVNGPDWVNSPLDCILPSPLPLPAILPAQVGTTGGVEMSLTDDPATHSCHITVLGTAPGSKPVVEMSKDLVNWVPLICVTENPSGCFQITDPVNPNAPHRFFRVRVAP